MSAQDGGRPERAGGHGQAGGPAPEGGQARPVVRLGAVRVHIPFRRPLVTAAGAWVHRESWIVRLVGENGREGIGEAALDPAAGETAELSLLRLIRDAAGRSVEGDLPEPAELDREGDPGRALRAALDSALLDLRERSELPPPRVAGTGLAATVAVNGTIGFGGPEAGAEAALQAIEAGFSTLKLKAGAERETDALVARVLAIRRAVGPEVRLRIDVNGAWDLATARERLAAIARFGIEHVEQPLPPDDPSLLAELRQDSPIPIAADESVSSVAAARVLLMLRAADVLVVKPARVGGLTAVAEIALMAEARGVPVIVSTLFETGVGVAAALRAAAALPGDGPGRGHGLATLGLLEADLLAVPLVAESGRMAVPPGPGLGVSLDERALQRFGVERVEAVG